MLGYHGYHTYYIHWASKFATSANIGNKAAYHIHWPSKLATRANKRDIKTMLAITETTLEELKNRYPGYPPCWQ